MNARDWFRRYSIQPLTAAVWDYKGLFKVVACAYCDEFMKSPFGNRDWWEPADLVIRKWHECEHCGTRNRITGVVKGRIEDA